MKKILIGISFLIACNLSSFATEKNNRQDISQWLVSDAMALHLPAFHATKNFQDQTFDLKNLLQEQTLKLENLEPKVSDSFSYFGQSVNWKKISVSANSYLSLPDTKGQLYYLVSYVNAQDWSKIDIELESFPMIELYVDNQLQLSSYQHENDTAKKQNKRLNLEPGHHKISVKILSGNKNNRFRLSMSSSPAQELEFSLSPRQMMDIHKVLDGTKVKDIQVSADGELALISYSRTLPPSDKSENWKEIQELKSGKIIRRFQSSEFSNIAWLPSEKQISYTKNYNGKTSFFILNLQTGLKKEIADNLDDFASYSWSPNGKYIIYSTRKDHSEDWKIRKIQGMEDRLPWFRTRSFLYKLDIASGVKQRLTFGALSTSLQDISPDSKRILFSQLRPDYTEYPYEKQNLYQMDMESFELDTIWKDKLFSGVAQYSPKGDQLLVQAGPSCFGSLGENIGNQPLANNYDGQLYLLDLKKGSVEPITLHFDPAVGQAKWNRKDGNIYIKADDQDYVRLFRYQPKSKKFEILKLEGDVLRNFDISTNGNTLCYTACSISSPYKAFTYDVKSGKNQLLADPQKEHLQNVAFGRTEDWNFVKADGDTIIGRVYYPPHFDASKKYPLIVNYYAGTVPVERSFGGRYPLNLYAAMGYVVYLLQPSGAIGFGQEFSARHQNNWGITTADEIIGATKKFVADHDFIQADKIGCIGASYGGFMTMLLQTKTDIFAAAISHAGISSIASYWGEGYWGYSYSVNASGKSFPWNNRKLYIDQSALFQADKIQTPMLLIHGSVDTNVPIGESIQLYQALKLLGKDVDFVQVKNQDHHILNYTQRILWNNTIFAYFAKYLKDQPDWWNELYPDKNL